MAKSKGRPQLAFWLMVPSQVAIEMAHLAGYDTVVLDMEHGVFTQDTADPTIAFAKAKGFTVYVRVIEAARIPIQQSLDAGADGVILPHIDNLAHATEVTGYAKYPPLGTRSVGGGRTWDYGGAPENFARRDNRRCKCIAMIETAGALRQVREIVGLPTVDGLFIGVFDLGMSRGRGAYSGSDADHVDVARIAEAANGAGKPWGLNVYSRPLRKLCRAHGIGLAAIADDYTALQMGAAALMADARAELAPAEKRRR